MHTKHTILSSYAMPTMYLNYTLYNILNPKSFHSACYRSKPRHKSISYNFKLGSYILYINIEIVYL